MFVDMIQNVIQITGTKHLEGNELINKTIL